MRISLLTVLVSPLTMRLNWEAETPIFSASSFCVMWFPLHKSEIRCPGVPGKAIDTHLLRILPLYRMIAKCNFQSVNFIKMQFSQYSGNCIFFV